MRFTLLGPRLAPAEGEKTVRTYHCTSLASRLLNLKAEGYLTVTNMRVVFYAYGSSYGGESVMHSEVPVADVSGINTYKGSYFSISHMLIALVASFIAGNIISGVVSSIIALVFAALSDSVEFNVVAAGRIIIGILGVISAIASNSYPRDKITRPVLATTGALFLSGPGGFGIALGMLQSLFGGNEFLNTILLIGAFIVGIYAIITIFHYARRETMSLTIGSRGGSNTPIAISGATVLGFFNTAALKALTAEPAQQSDAVIRELGAVISDIQILGDEGIQKWEAR